VSDRVSDFFCMG